MDIVIKDILTLLRRDCYRQEKIEQALRQGEGKFI